MTQTDILQAAKQYRTVFYRWSCLVNSDFLYHWVKCNLPSGLCLYEPFLDQSIDDIISDSFSQCAYSRPLIPPAGAKDSPLIISFSAGGKLI